MKKIEPYMTREDIRGKLIGLLNTGSWEEFNYLETRAGQVRGNHYHSETREVFFIIEGEIEAVVQAPGQEAITTLLRAGDVFLVEPGERHTFRCLTETRWINALSKRFDPNALDICV